MNVEADDGLPAEADNGLRRNWLVRVCMVLSMAALAAMALMTGAEVIARSAFHYSFEVTDEFGGYLLVALTFFSLPVCQAYGAFHDVEFVQARLSPRQRMLSGIAFNAVALACSMILLWQLVRFEWITWESGDEAPSILGTPLWIPRLAMPLGMTALCVVLLHTLGKQISTYWCRPTVHGS